MNGFEINLFLWHFFFHKLCRFSKDLYQMTGKHVKSRWKICWKFISPLIIFCVIIGGMVQMIEAIAKGNFTYTAWDRNQVSFQRRTCPHTDLPYRKKNTKKHFQNLIFMVPSKSRLKALEVQLNPRGRKIKWLGRLHQQLKLL